MSPNDSPAPLLGVRPAAGHRAGRRLALGALAALCATATLGSVVALFQHATSQPWLEPTAQRVAALARCDAVRDRPSRDRCHRQVVEQARSGPQRTLASR